MKTIKAVKTESKQSCFGCIFRGIQASCASLDFILEAAGLPDCSEGYIYVSCEVEDENTK